MFSPANQTSEHYSDLWRDLRPNEVPKIYPACCACPSAAWFKMVVTETEETKLGCYCTAMNKEAYLMLQPIMKCEMREELIEQQAKQTKNRQAEPEKA